MTGIKKLSTYKLKLIPIMLITVVIFLGILPVPYAKKTIPVVEGKADLPEGISTHIYALDGIWLLTQGREEGARLQEVPSVAWKYGFGTYELNLYVEKSQTAQPLELFTHTMGTSGQVFVNGKLIGEQGTYGETAEQAVATAKPEVYMFIPRAGWNHIEIHVSNFTDLRAGLWEQVLISQSPRLTQQFERRVDFDNLVLGIILFTALFTLILSLMMKEYHLLYFVAAIFFAALGNFMMISYSLYLEFPELHYSLMKKCSFSLFSLSGGCIIKSLASDLFYNRKTPVIDMISLLFLFMGVVYFLLPFTMASYISYVFHPIIGATFFYLILKQYTFIFSYPSSRSLRWGLPRMGFQFILLFGITHDSFSYVSGVFSYEVLPITSTIYAIGYCLLLVQSILHDRERIALAKSQMILIADHTRDQIRNDLHDRLAQLTNGMEFIAEGYLRNKHADEEQLRILRETAGEINIELRNILNGLGPARLDEIGLYAAIREMAEQNRRIYSVDFTTKLESGPVQEWANSTEQLYLVVRECITNALNHAEPSVINITLQNIDHTCFLTVENDGVVKYTFRKSVVAGHGIDIMRYRIESLGGRLSAYISNEGTFLVTAEVPEDCL